MVTYTNEPGISLPLVCRKKILRNSALPIALKFDVKSDPVKVRPLFFLKIPVANRQGEHHS